LVPQEIVMRLRALVSLPLLLPAVVLASQGLVAPAAETLWPQLQARISVQTAALPPLSLSTALDRAGPRSSGSAALLGDYVFAARRFGSFRASGGIVLGHGGWGSEATWSQPYLGLGFTSAALLEGLSITADLGWVSEQPRALFGTQGTQQALREMRVAPVMQLGLRYAF
jgi:hypothetical protein